MVAAVEAVYNYFAGGSCTRIFYSICEQYWKILELTVVGVWRVC